nr:tRNA preQ1(34) S-adenosylmethionine ribosyltransferase-isomerase QueA [Phaeovibrio sulfidiphilus]
MFDFNLPRECIADRPVSPRDSSRLLHVPAQGPFGDHIFRTLPDLLDPGDLLVLNDTRVIPARLQGRIGDGAIEVTLHFQESPDTWRVFARPAKKLRPERTVHFGDDLSASLIERGEGGDAVLRFSLSGEALTAAIRRLGHIPLPPYMGRADDARDRTDYQTVYARHEGAVAAPTAGLHFTDAVFEALAAKGIGHTTVTLHVGAGTFLPVTADDTQDHRMHAERGIISAEAAQAIRTARQRGGRIVAVGTTSARLLESACDDQGNLGPWEGQTRLFLTPGSPIRVVDRLLTNFHLPRSTLFMLVSAFCGLERMQDAYRHAVESGYRFYSYGDACLLDRDPAAPRSPLPRPEDTP